MVIVVVVVVLVVVGVVVLVVLTSVDVVEFSEGTAWLSASTFSGGVYFLSLLPQEEIKMTRNIILKMYHFPVKNFIKEL